MSAESRRGGVGPDGVAPRHSSGIKVIILGLGYAGVVAAVECHRKGHEVIVFEQNSEVRALGDVIGITGNGAQVIAKWGKGTVDAQLQPYLCDIGALNIYRPNGEFLTGHDMEGYTPGSGYTANRGVMAVTFYNYARKLGIDIRLGHRITNYFETKDEAGVILANGDRVTADCVIACDGVHSKARPFIVGSDTVSHATGYAVYRAWFDAKDVLKDPELATWLLEGGRDKMEVFIGPDIHCIVGTGRHCKDVIYVCTHKDNYTLTESWSFPGKREDALKVVEGWDERIKKVINHIPESQLVDYKLLWRDPLSTWVSKHGRMIVLGDAAHPFLPTSGQGGAQAVEDAATVAICLELAGKDDIPLALRACEKLRYARATLTQKVGVDTRDIWHKTDWESFKRDKKYLEMPRPEWIFSHDPQQYAYQEFEKAAKSVKTGSEYIPKNVPLPGADIRSTDFSQKKLKIEEKSRL